MSSSHKVWFITGASAGLGMELAKAVLAKGDRVVAGARRIDRLKALGGSSDQLLPVALDVTDESSRTSAIQTAFDTFGRIDVLANIAGRGCNGAAEEITTEQTRQLFELNFFGAVDLTRLALPHMRARRSGHIINVTSICGLVAMSDLTDYCASKFALEAWTEGLSGEVKHLGIRTTLVEPGGFRTEFEGSAILRPEVRIGEYAPVVQEIEAQLIGAAGKQLGDPAKAAQIMISAVEDSQSPLRLVLGSDALSFWDEAKEKVAMDIDSWRHVGATTDFPA